MITLKAVQDARRELMEYLKPIVPCENESCANRGSHIRHFHEIFATRKTIMRVDDPEVHAWVFLFLPNIAVLCEECHLNKLPSREYFYRERVGKYMPIREYVFIYSFCKTYANIVKKIPDLNPVSSDINKLFDIFDEFRSRCLIKTTLQRPKNYEA